MDGGYFELGAPPGWREEMALKANKGIRNDTLITSYVTRKVVLNGPKANVLRVLSDRFGYTQFKSELQGKAVEAVCQGKTSLIWLFLTEDIRIAYVPLNHDYLASYG